MSETQFSTHDLARLEDTRDAEGEPPVTAWRCACDACGRDVTVWCVDPGREHVILCDACDEASDSHDWEAAE